MDIKVIQDLISTLGFPMTASVALFWLLNEFKKDLIGEIKDLNKNLNEVVSKVATHDIRISHLEKSNK